MHVRCKNCHWHPTPPHASYETHFVLCPFLLKWISCLLAISKWLWCMIVTQLLCCQQVSLQCRDWICHKQCVESIMSSFNSSSDSFLLLSKCVAAATLSCVWFLQFLCLCDLKWSERRKKRNTSQRKLSFSPAFWGSQKEKESEKETVSYIWSMFVGMEQHWFLNNCKLMLLLACPSNHVQAVWRCHDLSLCHFCHRCLPLAKLGGLSFFQLCLCVSHHLSCLIPFVVLSMQLINVPSCCCHVFFSIHWQLLPIH